MIVLEQVKNGINLLLAGAGVLTIVTGDFVDGAIILGLITLNVSLSIIQEYRAEKALEALRALLPIQCAVVRDGKDVTALASELVPGDLVYIRTGELDPGRPEDLGSRQSRHQSGRRSQASRCRRPRPLTR